MARKEPVLLCLRKICCSIWFKGLNDDRTLNVATSVGPPFAAGLINRLLGLQAVSSEPSQPCRGVKMDDPGIT